MVIRDMEGDEYLEGDGDGGTHDAGRLRRYVGHSPVAGTQEDEEYYWSVLHYHEITEEEEEEWYERKRDEQRWAGYGNAWGIIRENSVRAAD